MCTILEMAEPEPPGPDVTQLLKRWKDGDARALDEVTPLVYRELREIAGRYLARERRDHTLQSTALVHEAFVRLVGQRRVDWQSRAHFFGLAAQMMRRILVDYARRAGRAKRGADTPTLALDGPGGIDVAEARPRNLVDVLTLDRALDGLDQIDPRQCRIVELRFFAGLTVEEIAEAMDLSPGTIKREWAIARAWLYRQIEMRPGSP